MKDSPVGQDHLQVEAVLLDGSIPDGAGLFTRTEQIFASGSSFELWFGGKMSLLALRDWRS